MMRKYTVRNEPDFAPVYDEDDPVSIRRGDLRALLDVATMSMDFGSGFLDNEQVEALRTVAAVLHIDPIEVTPHNFVCQYRGTHVWQSLPPTSYQLDASIQRWRCVQCEKYVTGPEKPADST